MNETTTAVVDVTHEVPAKVHNDLVTILSWPRPHGSAAELEFCQWLKARILKITGKPVTMLAEGSFYAQVNAKKGLQPTVMFSSHVDTVDNMADGALADGKIPQKSLTYDPNFGLIALDKDSHGGCLGADDGAGVWLMLQMIEQKVPGVYVWHRGEERGGVSANANLKAHKEFLAKFDIAVAFDRPRNNEVITHQGGAECASEKCGTALKVALNAHGMNYMVSNRGVFTDTKVYRGVIAECFNLGVGYESQHTKAETQDFAHLSALLNALCKVEWESLPVDRDPAKPDPYQFSNSRSGYPYRGGYGGMDDFGESFGVYRGGGYPEKGDHKALFKDLEKGAKKSKVVEPVISTFDELSCMPKDDLENWVEDDATAATESMLELLLEIGRLRSDVKLLKQLSGLSHD